MVIEKVLENLSFDDKIVVIFFVGLKTCCNFALEKF